MEHFFDARLDRFETVVSSVIGKIRTVVCLFVREVTETGPLSVIEIQRYEMFVGTFLPDFAFDSILYIFVIPLNRGSYRTFVLEYDRSRLFGVCIHTGS